MMDNADPYDSGVPKYQSATDIYESLQNMATGEEINLLSEMVENVSWDGQEYYYTDTAAKLVEKWEETTDNGNKMWLMDIAAWQLTDEDANDWIYQILCNDELAKRIGFKKIFVDTVLDGMSNRYNDVAEAFADELGELDRNGYYENMQALIAALTSIGISRYVNPYRELSSAVYYKLKGLRLDAERQLVIESRAMLTSYDDFIFGLKANQALYAEQEKSYQNKVAMLQSKYNTAVQMLLAMAQEQGVVLKLPEKLLIE